MLTGGRMMIFRNDVDNGEKPKAINPAELPSFSYVPMQLNDVLGSSLIDIGLLVLFNLIFFTAAYLGFMKYDVR